VTPRRAMQALLGSGLGLLLLAGGLLLAWDRPALRSGERSLPSPLAPWRTEFAQTPNGIVLRVFLTNSGARPTGPRRVLIDGRELLTWTTRPDTAPPGEDLLLEIRHLFRPGRPYAIALEDAEGRSRTLRISSPSFAPRLDLLELRGTVRPLGEQAEVTLTLSLDVSGFYRLTWLLEVWTEYAAAPEAALYLLDEPLSEEARRYAEAFRSWAVRLDPPLPVQGLDREGLRAIGASRAPGVLIVFTPLQGHRGPVPDALPLELLSAPASGRTDLLEGVQEWLQSGLVLVTPTTTHPLRALLRPDGRIQAPLAAINPGLALTGALTTWWSQTATLQREGAAAQALLWGIYRGEYGAVGELAEGDLYGYREFRNTFSEGPPPIRGRALRLYNPFFLRSGRGGWLAFSHNPPSPATLGHDLALVLLHAPWRGRPAGVPTPGRTETLVLQGGARRLERRISFPLPLPPSPSPSPPILRLLLLAEDPTAEPTRWVWREWIVPAAIEDEPRGTR